MKTKFKQYIKNIFKAFGVEIHKSGYSNSSPYSLGYISAKETIDAASKSGLSVGDYLETIWNHKGNRQVIIDELNKFGIFNKNIKNICEIGTGAGLYADKTAELFKPVRYESYEPDKDWAGWLAKKYNIISHDADGKSLSCTQTSSIDLVLAHGVYVYLPFLLTYRYFQEIVRVASDQCYVVFDIFSEDCLNTETVESWLESEQMFPCFLSKDYVIDFFTKHGFLLIGEFFNHKYNVGKSKYLIFKKES
jgi:hypothetical protein